MSDEKKIIIDEDWKSRVEAEKQAAQQRSGRDETLGSESSPPAATGEARGARPPAAYPRATFDVLVAGFVTEAMVALGQLPHPLTGKLEPERGHARYAIDMLEVLAEKTQGNLAPDEERGLRDALHQLRMAFISWGQPSPD